MKIVTVAWCDELLLTADSVFGGELSKQFEPSDTTPAPHVLMRCTAELEKRIQETGTEH